MNDENPIPFPTWRDDAKCEPKRINRKDQWNEWECRGVELPANNPHWRRVDRWEHAPEVSIFHALAAAKCCERCWAEHILASRGSKWLQDERTRTGEGFGEILNRLGAPRSRKVFDAWRTLERVGTKPGTPPEGGNE